MSSSTGGTPPGWSAGEPESLSRPEMDRLWLRRLGAVEYSGLLLEPPAPPEAFQQAVAEFNDGRYWEAHETLEGIWMQCPYPLRLFYYSLIKLSVGLLHLGRHNSVGARQQLAGAAEFFAPFAPRFLDVPVADLRAAAMDRLGRLDSPSWEEIDGLPRPRIPPAGPHRA